jgi:ABC-type glutathione transport system ATPase component
MALYGNKFPSSSVIVRGVIRLENINKAYRSGAGALHILCDVDLEVGNGEFVSIMRASGSGKSKRDVADLTDRTIFIEDGRTAAA